MLKRVQLSLERLFGYYSAIGSVVELKFEELTVDGSTPSLQTKS